MHPDGEITMPKAVTLVDNFGDNQTDTSKWSAFGPVMEVNQRLEIRPPSGGSNVYGGYVSAGSYDLTGSQVTVELARPRTWPKRRTTRSATAGCASASSWARSSSSTRPTGAGSSCSSAFPPRGA